MNAGEAVVETLVGAGVRRFYTVPGESFLEIIDAADRHPDATLVSCRHESGAAFMAEADGKLTGTPAVALGTRAVGAANLAIGVHTARQSRTPMLVLLGQVTAEVTGRAAFQEVDLDAFYAELTVSARTVRRPERAADAVRRAYLDATTGRPGPAMVAFPADVLAGGCPPEPITAPAPAFPDPRQVDALAAELRGAHRPVAIAGGGTRYHPAALAALARRYGLGVYTAFRRQDAFPNSDPHYLGHLTIGTDDTLLAALRDADLVLVLGSRLSEITTQGYRLPVPAARVVQVDADPATIGATVPVHRGLACDVPTAVEALLAVPGEDVPMDWSAGHAAHQRFTTAPRIAEPADGVHPAQVLAAMRAHLPAGCIMTGDAGNHAIFAHRYWRYDPPARQLAPQSGAMGYAVPAAVGAALAAPGSPVVATVGDGGFLMTGQEIETAVRHGAPILTVVLRNGLYGTIAAHQARATGRLAGVGIGAVDIAGYARALGADAVTVDDPADLDDAFATAATFDAPRVIAVHTAPDVIAPGTSLRTLLGERSRP